MKLFNFFLLFISFNVLSQFTELTNHNLTKSIWDFSCEGNKLLVVGEEGAIYSTNAGNSFTTLASFPNQTQQDIFDRSVLSGGVINGNSLYLYGKDTVENQINIFYSQNVSSWYILRYDFPDDTIHSSLVTNNRACFFGNSYFETYSQNTISEQGVIDLSGSSSFSGATADFSRYLTCGPSKIAELSINTPIWSVYYHPHIFLDIAIGNAVSGITYLNTDEELFVTSFNNQLPSIVKSIELGGASLNWLDRPRTMMNTSVFLGTSEGVFIKKHNVYYFEKIKNLTGFIINKMSGNDGSLVYAVGEDGVILRYSSHNNIETYPFVGYNYEEVYCLDSTYTLNNLGNSSYDYQWFFNGVLISTDFNLDNFTFSDPGNHQITLVGDNGVEIDTQEVFFDVIIPPLDTIVYSVSSPIICFEGKVDFIFETQQNVKYALMRGSSSIPDTVFIGNGGVMEIESQLINDTTSFLLIAGYPSKTCYVEHILDTIIVQKPKANFHVDLINADLNEEVLLYDMSLRSDTSVWLSAPANLAFDVNYDEENRFSIFYENSGYKTLGLIAISEFGCMDTLIREKALYVVDSLELIEGCFILEVKEQQSTPWSNIGYNCKALARDSAGGFIVSYPSLNSNVPSQTGISIDTIYTRGFIVAKYDKYGVLKWIVTEDHEQYSGGAGGSSTQRGVVSNIEILENGDIILSSDKSSHIDYLYCNTGRKFHNDGTGSYSLIRLNKRGAFQSSLRAYKMNYVSGECDTLGNYYVCTIDNSFTNLDDDLKFQNRDTSFLINHDFNMRLFKVNANGSISWQLPTDFIALNVKYKNSNIYIYGTGLNTGLLYSTDGNDIEINNISNPVNAVYTSFDTSGVYNWHVRFNYFNNNNFLFSLDNDNNSYARYFNNGDDFFVYDSNDQLLEYKSGLTKFDSDGNMVFTYTLNNNNSLNGYNLKVTDNTINISTTYNNSLASEYGFYTSTTTSDTIALSPFSDYTVLYTYNTNGDLLNLDVFGDGHVEDSINTRPIFAKTAIDEEHGEIYGLSNYVGFVRNNTQYGINPLNRFILTNSLDFYCGAERLQIFEVDTVCHIDTINIPVNLNVQPYQQISSNNLVLVEYSETPVFNSTLMVDTLNSNGDLSDLNWGFDFSSSMPENIWFRIRITSPNLISNPIKLTFTTFQLDTLNTNFFFCQEGEELTLETTAGTTYNWTIEPSNNLTHNTNVFTGTTSDSSQLYSVEVTNACGIEWIHYFELTKYDFSPHNYTADSIDFCVGDTLEIIFDNQYIYFLDTFTYQLNDFSYLLYFENNYLMPYVYMDENQCLYDDSIYFSSNPIPLIEFDLTGSPWEIIANPYDPNATYNWFSNYNFIPGAFPNVISPLEDGEFSVEVISEFGCFNSDTLHFSTVGLENLLNNVNIHPNPTNNFLNVFSNQIIDSISVVNSLGKVLFSNSIQSSNYILDVQNFSKGIYFIRVHANSGFYIKRFVVN